jgi:hypothetical protein
VARIEGEKEGRQRKQAVHIIVSQRELDARKMTKRPYAASFRFTAEVLPVRRSACSSYVTF